MPYKKPNTLKYVPALLASTGHCSQEQLQRFFESETLCLENCHSNPARRAIEESTDNPLINQNASFETSSSLSSDLGKLKKALMDLMRLVQKGELYHWTAFYTYSEVMGALYVRREEAKVKALLIWLGRGLQLSLDLQWDSMMHTPFLVKLIKLLENEGYLKESISVCDYAIQKQIPDSTIKGYNGRKQRLEKKLMGDAESCEIDWHAIRAEALAFFSDSHTSSGLDTDSIKAIAKKIKSFCNKAKKLPKDQRVTAFHDFKHSILPLIEEGMEKEAEIEVRATWSSHRWLYKELFKLESDYWFWCQQPILTWYRGTMQKPDTWPEWLIKEYGYFNQLEYRLFANAVPFNSADVLALTESPITEWGLEHEFEKILWHVDDILTKYHEEHGGCFVRDFFQHPSYWHQGSVDDDEKAKQLELFDELILIGAIKSESDYTLRSFSVRLMSLGSRGALYNFPQVWSQYFWLPDIPKLNLSYKLKEIFRSAENKVREDFGIPKVGEGWVSEAQLFAYIFLITLDSQLLRRPGANLKFPNESRSFQWPRIKCNFRKA